MSFAPEVHVGRGDDPCSTRNGSALWRVLESIYIPIANAKGPRCLHIHGRNNWQPSVELNDVHYPRGFSGWCNLRPSRGWPVAHSAIRSYKGGPCESAAVPKTAE